MKYLRPILWLVSFLLVISLSRSVVSLLSKRDIIRQQEGELARLSQENAQLQDALVRADTPEFIEKQAREKLGLVKDGETVVILPNTNHQSPITSTQQGSNWEKWWELFF